MSRTKCSVNCDHCRKMGNVPKKPVATIPATGQLQVKEPIDPKNIQ